MGRNGDAVWQVLSQTAHATFGKKGDQTHEGRSAKEHRIPGSGGGNAGGLGSGGA